jgi:hypothetical protein
MYRKQGKCEYIKYSTSASNNDMQAYNMKDLTKKVDSHRKHLDLDNI